MVNTLFLFNRYSPPPLHFPFLSLCKPSPSPPVSPHSGFPTLSSNTMFPPVNFKSRPNIIAVESRPQVLPPPIIVALPRRRIPSTAMFATPGQGKLEAIEMVKRIMVPEEDTPYDGSCLDASFPVGLLSSFTIFDYLGEAVKFNEVPEEVTPLDGLSFVASLGSSISGALSLEGDGKHSNDDTKMENKPLLSSAEQVVNSSRVDCPVGELMPKFGTAIHASDEAVKCNVVPEEGSPYDGLSFAANVGSSISGCLSLEGDGKLSSDGTLSPSENKQPMPKFGAAIEASGEVVKCNVIPEEGTLFDGLSSVANAGSSISAGFSLEGDGKHSNDGALSPSEIKQPMPKFGAAIQASGEAVKCNVVPEEGTPYDGLSLTASVGTSISRGLSFEGDGKHSNDCTMSSSENKSLLSSAEQVVNSSRVDFPVGESMPEFCDAIQPSGEDVKCTVVPEEGTLYDGPTLAARSFGFLNRFFRFLRGVLLQLINYVVQ